MILEEAVALSSTLVVGDARRDRVARLGAAKGGRERHHRLLAFEYRSCIGLRCRPRRDRYGAACAILRTPLRRFEPEKVCNQQSWSALSSSPMSASYHREQPAAILFLLFGRASYSPALPVPFAGGRPG